MSKAGTELHGIVFPAICLDDALQGRGDAWHGHADDDTGGQ